MPPQMVKLATRALVQSVFQLARAFKERWPVVIYDHAETVYDRLN
jgi:hypothetical protein